MDKIKFDKKKHKYYKADKEYVSVTTLLAEEFPFNAKEIASRLVKQPGKYNGLKVADVLKDWQQSAVYGTKIHSAAENYLLHEKFPNNEEFVPIIEKFSKLNWRGKILSETLVHDDNYLIAGTVDILEDMGDYFYLWDIKTSVAKNGKLPTEKIKKFSMQLEIYKRLVEKTFNKKVKIGGIIWFKDCRNLREKTPIEVIKAVNCKQKVNKILLKRKRMIDL